MMAYCYTLAILAFLVTSGCRAEQPDRPLAIVVSCDTAGWIVPCGCTSNQSGGLARRGTFVKQLAAEADMIVADVGGAPGGVSPYDREKFRAILKGERALTLDAHNLGAAELALGAEELHQIAQEQVVPLVSANVRAKVRDSAGEPIAPPARLVERGGRRVLLVGVVSPQFATPAWEISDPRDAVLDAVAKQQPRPDVVVVLAYLPADELRTLAAALPEVDLVVGGPTRQSIALEQVRPTTLAAVTNKGKFIAHFTVPQRGAAWQGEIVEMTGDFADDPAQLAVLKEFRAALAERDFTAAETGLVPPLPADVPAGYQVAGTESCRACHTGDCRAWDESRHAHAWQTLAGQNAHVDSSCQQCHTTAFGLPGGFASVRTTSNRVAVGCESCHGPSQAHIANTHRRTPFAAADQCVRCHDRDNSPQFAYEPYWDQISHGAPATATAANSATSTEEEP